MRYSLLPVFILALALTACVSVYKVEIQQGNVVTQEMIDKLKPGMTRSQVRFVLGTPLVTDAFHPDRWDYYYLLRPSGDRDTQTRRLSVIFKDDALQSVQNDSPETPQDKPTVGQPG